LQAWHTQGAESVSKPAPNYPGVIAPNAERWRNPQLSFTAALKEEPHNVKTHHLLAKAQRKNGDVKQRAPGNRSGAQT